MANRTVYGQKITKITGVFHYHLRCLKQVRRILGPEIAVRLVLAYVIRWLDYLDGSTQGINNATKTNTERRRQTNCLVCETTSHRQSVTFTGEVPIIYKLCLMMHAAHNHPTYIGDVFYYFTLQTRDWLPSIATKFLGFI